MLEQSPSKVLPYKKKISHNRWIDSIAKITHYSRLLIFGLVISLPVMKNHTVVVHNFNIDKDKVAKVYIHCMYKYVHITCIFWSHVIILMDSEGYALCRKDLKYILNV